MLSFLSIPSTYLLYFFYGGAFLFLSAAIAMKDMRASELKIARSLWLLALFGFTHGVHEWLQIYPLIEAEHLSVRGIYYVKAVALGLFVVSFIFLMQFGLALIRAVHTRHIPWLSALPAVLFLLWFAIIAHHGFTMDLQFLRQASIGARHTFGLVGGAMTAYGLISYSREIGHLSRFVARRLRYAGITFALYAVFAGIFSSSFTLFRLPIPVEILRGLSAVMITYFIVKALNIFDIEMRKKIEQQSRRIVLAEKLTSLGQLAAGIAHEINNPLTNASLGIQTLRNQIGSHDAGGKVAERLDAVERNIDKASTIARELLLFSHQKEVDYLPLNVNTIIRGALTLLNYKLKDISVRDAFGDVPDVMGDPGKLEQVFINILANAVEAMPQGGSLTITTRFDGRNVQVRVDDTGSGIPDEHLSRVFDPFFTSKEVGAGTGLGLSICYGIVKQHNGTIELASGVCRGTTVTIGLPVREGA